MQTFQIELPDEVAKLVGKRSFIGGLLEHLLKTAITIHGYQQSYRYADGQVLTDEELADVATLFGQLGHFIQKSHGIGRQFVSQEEAMRRKAKSERSWQTRRSREAGAEVVALPAPEKREPTPFRLIEGGVDG